MIYADFNGTSPLCGKVSEYLIKRLQNNGPYANPNAIHGQGSKVMMGINKCRVTCAKSLNCKPNQIIFNSGSSEGISHVFYSVLEQTTRKTIIISSIEHSAVLNAAKYYESKGYKVHKIKVSSDGVVDLDQLEDVLKTNQDDLALVSIMAANNETGVIQPFHEIGSLCQKYDVPYFSDTTQIIGKDKFDFENSNMDYAVVSGHKIGALIGSGFVIAKQPHKMIAHVFGGGQEKGLRGGTQNYIGIETLAVALDSFNSNLEMVSAANKNREDFEKALKDKFPKIVILGDSAKRLASTTLVSYPGIHGQAIQIELESEDIFVTTSSACSDNEPNTSKVLKAMKVTDDIGRGVIRVSLCLMNNEDKYQKIFKALSNAYNKLAKIESY